MSTRFFTNQAGNSLLSKLEGVFTHVENIRHFDALVGYFRASGYFKVRPFLEKVDKIRILVGIEVDRLTKSYHDRGQQYIENPHTTRKAFLEEMIRNIQQADYNKETEEGIIQFINDILDEKIEMRAHPKKTIHAKVYIFRPERFNEHTNCEVITGSSNLSISGLGLNPDHNYEFNVSLRNYEDVKFATDEFERLWNESVPILQAQAEAIKSKTYLRDDFTPFELYIKMLIEYFGKRVEYDPYNIDLLLPNKFMPLKYQSDAANQGYAIMMKHHGFILADVVGLGKTIVACMVIKKFIYENGTHTRVLIVVPPALEVNWRETTEDFQIKNHFEFITLGSLHKVLDEKDYTYSNAEKFDLVVVDESHKFRNDYTDMYLKLQEISKKPRAHPADNGDSRKKVILISATPLNNRPQDIENQLYLFQDRRNSTLENIRNLQEYFKPINEQYKKLSNEPTLNIQKLKLLFQRLRDDVIEPLVIRRTRTDIENNQEYLDDLKTQNIVFPRIDDPIPVYYELDDTLSTLFLDTVTMITGLDEQGAPTEGLSYYRYRAIEYLANEKDRKVYGNVGQITGRLSAIMRTLLVKRLESSFFAFKQSLSRLQKATQNMLDMLAHDRVFVAPDMNINQLLEQGYSYDEIEAKVTGKGGNNQAFSTKDFDQTFANHLAEDKAKIDQLLVRWNQVSSDPKLIEFTHQIKNTFFQPKKNKQGKLVIFTESKETAQELHETLVKLGSFRSLMVSADTRKALEHTLRENFDANLDKAQQKDEYDIVVTTEVLAEGINLHRSNLILNYDVPWNATRLMQRIGRVNRIGSAAPRIYVYNFYPSAQGDAQIKLVNTALRKLQAFHTAFGEDNRVFSLLEELEEKGGLFGSKIQREESETLKYLNELREFRKKHPQRFAEIKRTPNKARCGRQATGRQLTLIDNEENQINYPLAQTSLTYLKSDNHPGVFCLVTPELNTLELNFLQAVKIYKADDSEQPIKLHTQHYEQTQTGLTFFRTEKNQRSIRQVNRKNLSTAENKALKNLNAILKIAPTEQKKQALQRCMAMIKQGTFASQGLPKSVNEFFKRHARLMREPDNFIATLFSEVLDRYDLSARAETDQTPTPEQLRGIVNPTIVLTQSFS